MFRSPHKKSNPWSKGYQPVFAGNGTPNKGGHSGGVPAGKKKKMDRVKTGPVGSPNGRHNDKDSQNCNCGRCINERLGMPRELIIGRR